MGDIKKDGIMMGLCILTGLAVAGLAIYITTQYEAKHAPKVMTEEQLKQPETVAKEIHVSEPAANIP